MSRLRLTLFLLPPLALSALTSLGRNKPTVTFTSECSCDGNHGVSRWKAKTDLSEPPPNKAEIQAITPSEMYEWKGPGGNIDHDSGRIGPEQKGEG